MKDCTCLAGPMARLHRPECALSPHQPDAGEWRVFDPAPGGDLVVCTQDGGFVCKADTPDLAQRIIADHNAAQERDRLRAALAIEHAAALFNGASISSSSEDAVAEDSAHAIDVEAGRYRAFLCDVCALL